MLYNPKEVEEKILKKWEEEETYKKVRERGKEKFYFCDGPPYASGFLHLGQTLNYSLKDSWIRVLRLKGYKVFDRQGYDTHGTPIEVKVEKALGFTSKKDIERGGLKNFISKCKEFATKNISKQKEQLKDIGVWMDLENPYLTFSDDFILAIWRTFKKAEEKGLLYKGVYPVYSCPRCETVVAYNEIEYKNIEDIAIYVLIKLRGKDEYLVIWTTTPWTLPANVAVVVNPNFRYVELDYNNKKIIVAKELSKKFENSQIIKEFSGRELVGLEYEPILEDNKITPIIVPSEKFVTLEEGTGLVHCAPGHGKEDFEIGKENNLKVVCPVGLDGRFKETKYKDKLVFDANKEIVDELREKGVLLKEEKIKHDYPTCWRCHTKLITLTIPEYFFGATKIRDKLLEENEKIYWKPNWAKERFKDWLKSIGDWPVSRQRYWGTPVPIWECNKCGKIEVIGSREELEQKSKRKVTELHRPEIDEIEIPCDCGGRKKRIPDVFDVWLDSGVASWANFDNSKELFEKFWPADLEIEGSDQIRGWWNSQLILSVIAFDRRPFETIIYHGMILDNVGKKMSKSIGNVVMPGDIISKYGRDVLRLTLLSEVPWKDIFFSFDLAKTAFNKLNIIYNCFQYFKNYKKSENYPIKLQTEDKWIISRLNSVIEKSDEYLSKKELHNYIREVVDFLVEDVSRVYIKLVRDKILVSSSVSKVLDEVLQKVNILISPFAPFLSESLYFGNKNSVFLENWPKVEKEKINSELEEKFEIAKEISKAMNSERQKHSVRLRLPIKKATVFGSTKIKEVIDETKEIIKSLSNLKEIEFKESEKVEIKPNFAKIGKKFGARTSEVAKLISKMKPEDLKDEIELGEFKIKRDDLVVRQRGVEGTIFSKGYVTLDLTEDKELKEERFLRELIREIQKARQEEKLNVLDRITLFLEDKEFIKKFEDELKKEVRAEKIVYGLGEKTIIREANGAPFAKQMRELEASYKDLNLAFGFERYVL